eukprot:gb/GECG01002046.1/.p1 GENE.gb/GECG01002046.1/~~gb/GECG01002046.1/.p1  ORF type:complete len:421 (+),score=79.44 gb/GECG01002046.1/:1-1263(+)
MNDDEDGTASSFSSSSYPIQPGMGAYNGAIVSTTLWRELCKRVPHTAEIEEIRYKLDPELIDTNEELMAEIQSYTEILDDIRGRVEDHEARKQKKNSSSSASKDYTHERRQRQAKLLHQQISYFVHVLESRGIDPVSSVGARGTEQRPSRKEELLRKYKKLEASDTEAHRDDTHRYSRHEDRSPQRVSSATRSRESPQGTRSRFKRRLYEDLAACSASEKAPTDTDNRRPSTASSRPTTASSTMDLSVSSAPNMLDNVEEHLNAFQIDTVAMELKQALREEYEQLSEERQHLEQQVFEETMSGANVGAFTASIGAEVGASNDATEEETSLNEMKALKAELQQQYLQSEQESANGKVNAQTQSQSTVSAEQRRHLDQITAGFRSSAEAPAERIPTGGRPGTAAGIDKELDELFVRDVDNKS